MTGRKARDTAGAGRGERHPRFPRRLSKTRQLTWKTPQGMSTKF